MSEGNAVAENEAAAEIVIPAVITSDDFVAEGSYKLSRIEAEFFRDGTM